MSIPFFVLFSTTDASFVGSGKVLVRFLASRLWASGRPRPLVHGEFIMFAAPFAKYIFIYFYLESKSEMLVRLESVKWVSIV